MNIQPTCLALILLAFISVPISAQRPRRQPPSKLEQHMKMIADNWGFSGTVLVEKEGKEVLRYSNGSPDLSSSMPFRQTTVFRLRGLSHAIISVIAERMAAQKMIDLDARVDSVLTRLPADGAGARKIRDLLRQGIRFPGAEGQDRTGMSLFREVLETVTGRHAGLFIEEFCRNEFGTTNAGVYSPRKVASGQAQSYVHAAGQLIAADATVEPLELVATADDVLKIARSVAGREMTPDSIRSLSGQKLQAFPGWNIVTTEGSGEPTTRSACSSPHDSGSMIAIVDAGPTIVVWLRNADARYQDFSPAGSLKNFHFLHDLALVANGVKRSSSLPNHLKQPWARVHRGDIDGAARDCRAYFAEGGDGRTPDSEADMDNASGQSAARRRTQAMGDAKLLLGAGEFRAAANVLRFLLAVKPGWTDAQMLLKSIDGPDTRPPQFVELHRTFKDAPKWTDSVHPIDVNKDGKLDIVFSNCNGWRRPGDMAAPSADPLMPTLMLNVTGADGVVRFEDKSADYFPADFKVHAKNVAVCDIDSDGHQDLVFAVAFGAQQRVLRFDPEQGRFCDETKERLPELVLNSNGVGWGDLDGDGDIDLVWVDSGPNSDRNPGGKARLLLNDGKGVFKDESARLKASEKVGAQNAKLIDLDNDMDLDIVVDGKSQVTQLYINDGAANFTPDLKTIPSAERGGQPYEIEWADLDNDGDLDAVHMSWGGGRRDRYKNVMLRNNLVESGELSFEVVDGGFTGRNNEDENEFAFLDADQDGDLDLVVATLIAGRQADEKLYLNDGEFGPGFMKQKDGAFSLFVDGTLDLTIADFDNDGRPDVVTAQGESKRYEGFENRFYKNFGPKDERGPVLVRASKGLRKHGDVYVLDALWTDAIQDDGESLITVKVNYEISGGDAVVAVASMTHVGSGMFRAELTGVQSGAVVTCHMLAADRAGNQTQVTLKPIKVP